MIGISLEVHLGIPICGVQFQFDCLTFIAYMASPAVDMPSTNAKIVCICIGERKRERERERERKRVGEYSCMCVYLGLQ